MPVIGSLLKLRGAALWRLAMSVIWAMTLLTMAPGLVLSQAPRAIELVLKLRAQSGLSFAQGRFETSEGRKTPSVDRLNDLLAGPIVTAVRPLFSGGKKTAADLRRYYTLRLKPGVTPGEVEELRSQLASQDVIELVYIAPVPKNASAKLPATSGDLGVSTGKGK